MIIKDFTDIQLSLSSLKHSITNQIKHSKRNYLFAIDIDLSLLFIKRLEKTLEIMEKLFGKENLNNNTTYCNITGGKIIE